MGSLGKRNDNKCADCYRTARKRKTKKGIRYDKYCSGCDKKRWRKANPMKYAYQNFLSNAKRRKIFCDVTWEQFKELCYETNYIQGKGRSSKSFTLDRIIEGRLPGYTKSNIQILPKGVNSQKEQARRKSKFLVYDWQTKTAIYINKDDSSVHDNDNPF